MSRTASVNPDEPAQVPWYHWLWVAPVALGLRLWIATLRFRIEGARPDDREAPSVLLLWHDKLLVAPWIAQRILTRPVTALISTSQDGAWLVAFFRLMGITAARGSSNRRGAAALVTLTRALRSGRHAGITPDGPKGPARRVKVGAVALARLAKRPFVIMGIRYRSCWRLASWDRFALPFPFSVVELTFVSAPLPEAGEADEAVADRLEARLNALSADPV